MAVLAVSSGVVDEPVRERPLAAQFLVCSSTSADQLLAQVAHSDRVVGEYRQRHGFDPEWWASRQCSASDAAPVPVPSGGNADGHRAGEAS
ncbi:hypothetical protein [Micromonospora antibiotica]|uniref:Uncharacterized protein n=1 Tax=Micromonospora antibiotica TaxID=2807623 RepID=A0ABS3V738_9ACTN|nr:hypothetical protein [Micromonospora antibiotica]MBO4161438.1 hypothetical protein [Micromonospora antibiotica]